jgi:GT2 family glycosyltransferase
VSAAPETLLSTAIDLSVLIVSWNVRDLLADCLASIAAGPVTLIAPDGTLPGEGDLLTEVIVVDSASSDGTPDLVRARFPWVTLIACDENIGFTRGNNLALARARGRYLLLLNPDTVVHDDALPALVHHLDTQPEVGIAGPRVLNADGSTQSTRRRFPTPLTAFFESTWLQSHAPRRILDRYYVTDQPDDGIYEVDWVQGCALLARRAVYEQIGGLDEGYVMFSEELDWCRRARLAGWRVHYVGTARITHYGGQSTGQVETRKHIYFQQSKLRYFRKYHGRAFAFALRLFLLVSYAWQLVLEAAKGILGHKRALRRARARTYWAVLGALALGRRPGE